MQQNTQWKKSFRAFRQWGKLMLIKITFIKTHYIYIYIYIYCMS